MLTSPLSTFEHKRFYSMIDKDDPEVIPDFFAANIENWLIRDKGEIKMREGLTAMGTNPGATNLGAGVLNNNVTGNKYLVRVLNGAGNTSKFQHSTDGTTWIDTPGGGSLRTDLIWSFTQANNRLYGMNGINTIKFDGASVVAWPGSPPVGTAIEWFKNHMFIIGVPSVPDRLYISNPNDPETFGGSDFININLGDASKGVGLRGQAGQSGRLYIGKEKSVWYLTGVDVSDFAIAPLTYEHGVASHESMLAVENSVWCIDQEGVVRDLYRTTTDEPFTRSAIDDLTNTVAGLNAVSLNKTSAVYFDGYVLYFVPYGVDSHNSLVLVYDTLANEKKGGWIKFTEWRIARAVIFQQSEPTLYLHDSRTGNGQTYTWSGTSDNGQAITAKYETKIYNHGLPERRKKWKFAYQFGPVMGSVEVKFYVSIDRYYYTLLKAFNLTGTGNHLLGINWVLGTDKLGSGGFVQERIRYTDGGGMNKGYTQQVKLEATSTTVQVRLRKFTSHFRGKGLR